MSVAPSTQLLRQRSDELFGTVPEAGALDRPITLRVPLGHGRVLSPVGFGFALAGVVLVSYAWAVGARPLALPGMLCLATTIIGIATARRVDGLGILVPTTRVRATLGQELCVDVDVIASRAQPTMRLQLDVPTLPAIVGTVPELRAGERTTVRLRGPAARRVVTDKVRITATDAGALGITSTSRAWTVDVDLAVVPAWHTVPAPPRIPVAADDNGDDGFTTIGRPRWSGVEPRGLRPLRRGDPWRAVHARASARRGRPIVREWEPPAVPQRDVAVLLQLVGGGSDAAHPARCEAVVSEAASIAMACAAAGDQVHVEVPIAAPARGASFGVGYASCETADDVLRCLAAVPYWSQIPWPRLMHAVAHAQAGDLIVVGAGLGRPLSAAERAELEQCVRSRGADLVLLDAAEVPRAVV